MSVIFCLLAVPKLPSNRTTGARPAGWMATVGTWLRSVCSSRSGVPSCDREACTTPETVLPSIQAWTYAARRPYFRG